GGGLLHRRAKKGDDRHGGRKRLSCGSGTDHRRTPRSGTGGRGGCAGSQMGGGGGGRRRSEDGFLPDRRGTEVLPEGQTGRVQDSQSRPFHGRTAEDARGQDRQAGHPPPLCPKGLKFREVDAMRRGMRLLKTKWIPPAPKSSTFRRPEVSKKLKGLVHSPLTLVHAAPGYGKTTAVACFMQDEQLTAGWYRIGEDDAKPAV